MKSVLELIELYNLTSKNFADYIFLDELTYKDLRRRAPNYLNVRDKSKHTPGVSYRGIEDDIVEFETPSHTEPGKTYQQYVKLLDLNKLIQTNGGVKRPIDIVREALQGDIEVHCTDPSWLYWGFKYIGTQDKYSIDPETRHPNVRNPKLEGSICKHLDAVLYVLPFHASEITRDLRKQKRL